MTTSIHSFFVLAAWLWILMYFAICAGIEIDEEALYQHIEVTDYGQEPIPANELATGAGWASGASPALPRWSTTPAS